MKGMIMRHKIIGLSALLILSGCIKNHKNTEVQLVEFKRTSSYYEITFLSEANFSIRESTRNTGSYIHCINDKRIYGDKYIPDYSSNNYLSGNIPKNTKPTADTLSDQYIYSIKLDSSTYLENDKTLYCRIFTGNFPGKLKKSQVLELIP